MQQRSETISRRQFLQLAGFTGVLGVGLGLAGRGASAVLDETESPSDSASSVASRRSFPPPRDVSDG